jgi:hypothetical protein
MPKSWAWADRARIAAMTRTLCLAQNPDADALLASDRFALLLGLLLDQHTA